MKNIKQDVGDSLRPEYRRADFGEMVRGKYAKTQIEFAELVHLLLTCIGEDEGLTFISHSPGNRLAGHKLGDWTYEFDNANRITLRYWLSEFNSLEEPLSNPPCVITNEAGSDLQTLLVQHVRGLKARVDAL
ncbi:MAG: hypothetical protein LC794_08285 [Acidobacteria bacterium]|nr:hypothetical protein [Acidobacteriota bacterium]